MNLDFDPLKAFTTLDLDQDGHLSPLDLQSFLKNSYLRVSLSEAELIVKEYDGDLDGKLDF